MTVNLICKYIENLHQMIDIQTTTVVTIDPFSGPTKWVRPTKWVYGCNPSSHKIRTVKALLKRAFTICLDEDSKIQELDKVRKDLLNNGYPRTIIDKCSREIMQPKLPLLDSTESQKYIEASYLKVVTEKKLLKYSENII